MGEWFRTPDWDAAAREDFEQRLGRARSSRPQYLRIKALALTSVGLFDDAVRLLERLRTEHPDAFDVWYATEVLGDIAREQGRLDEAEHHYRRLLSSPERNGTSGMVEVSLAEVLLEAGRADDAAVALEQADRDSVDTFHANLFRFLVTRARIDAARGHVDGAATAAARALELVDAPSQYPRHPGVGVVRTDDASIDALQEMTRAGGPGAPPGDDRAEEEL